jgi:hypothetical protein
VKAFNVRAAKDPVGVNRPPLTVDEVVAAIRMLNRTQWTMDEPTYKKFQQIAATNRLPSDAILDVLTKATTNGYEFSMWRIDLEISPGKIGGYRLPLRTHMMGSVPVNPQSDQFRVIGQ